MMRAKVFSAVSIALVAAASQLSAQDKTPPTAGALRPYSVPSVQSFVLNNGMRVLLVERHGLPVVTARFIVDAGAMREPADKNGLAVLTGDLLSEGAKGLTGAQIAEQMADLGASFSTFGDYGTAYVALTRKDYAEARTRFNQGLIFFHDTGDKQFENMARSGLGDVVRLEGNYRDAISHYWEALAVWQKMGRRGAVARLLECFGFIASAQGRNANPPELARLETASRLLGAANTLRQISDSKMVPEETAEYAVELDALKGAVTEEIFRAAWAEGHKMTMEQAIEYARQEVRA